MGAAPPPGAVDRVARHGAAIQISGLRPDAFFGDLRSAMARIEFSSHLPGLFPQLGGGTLTLAASTVAQAVTALDALAPGVAFYICDERGRLRRHVNIFVDGEMIVDRRTLGDALAPDTHVFIAQALSGG